MADKKKIIVIGAGIVGLSTAFYAKRSGWDVVLVDPRGIGNGASFGNAGVVAVTECVPIGTPGILKKIPSMLLSPDSPLKIRKSYFISVFPWLLRLLRSSNTTRVEEISIALNSLLQLSGDAHKEISGEGGFSHLLNKQGYLKVFLEKEGVSTISEELAIMQRRGVNYSILDNQSIQKIEPSLSDEFQSGVYFPDCMNVGDPSVYVSSLGKYLIDSGVEFINEDITDFNIKDGIIHSVKAGNKEITGDNFVLAAGAWSGNLLKKMGISVPLDTERGYHMMLESGDKYSHQMTKTPVLFADKSIVASGMGKHKRITSGVEFAGLNGGPDFRLVLKYLPFIKQAFKEKVHTTPSSTWLGFRPSMPDSMPIIDSIPTLTNCICAFGHGHIGLTLGPITGKIVAELIALEKPAVDIRPFSISRFN